MGCFWCYAGKLPVFIFKYLSDLGVLTGMYSFYHLLAQYAGNNDNEVLEFYANTVRKKIKELFPGNAKDNTTIINGTIFVSKDDKAVAGYATVFHRILTRFNNFGTVTKLDKAQKHIRVTFAVGEKTFIFPHAFKMGFLKMKD